MSVHSSVRLVWGATAIFEYFIEKQTDNFLYFLKECDYASTRRDKLKEHKSRHHGVNASAKSPYKPRPHKSTKTKSFGDQTVVYAKKSTVQQAQAQQSGSGTSSQLQISQVLN